MTARTGMSLLELLVVVAVLGILMGVGMPAYGAWRANTLVAEASVQLARDVDGLRSSSKRTNAQRSLTVTAGTSSYTVDGRTVTLPGGVRFAASGSSAGTTFLPPYGTKNTAVDTYRLVSISHPDITRVVRVVGVTGKVVIKRE